MTLVVLLLAGAAWLVLWSWSLDGHAHHSWGAPLGGSPTQSAGAAWLVMVIAMMLPLAAQLLASVRRLVGRRPRPGLLVALAGAAFLAPWLVAGQLAQAAAVGLDALGSRLWAGLDPGVLVGAAVGAVGVVQVSALKQRSLGACRSPVSFALGHWRGGSCPARDVLRIGATYGISCLGCCWALMAVSVAAGAAGMVVMLPVTAVKVIERITPWGPAFAKVSGAALILIGAALTAVSIL